MSPLDRVNCSPRPRGKSESWHSGFGILSDFWFRGFGIRHRRAHLVLRQSRSSDRTLSLQDFHSMASTSNPASHETLGDRSWEVPYPQNPNFVGREDYLTSLR